MNKDNAPFYVGQKVVSITDGFPNLCPKGTVCIVQNLIKFPCGCWSIEIGISHGEAAVYYCRKHETRIKGGTQRLFASYVFAPYNPYSNSVSKELAEKVMSVGDGADQPIKIKELQTANN